MSNITLSVKNVTIFLIFSCFNFVTVFGMSQITFGNEQNKLFILVNIVGMILLAAYYWQVRKFSINNIVVISFLIIPSILTFVSTQNMGIFTTVLCILCMKQLSLKKALKYNLMTLIGWSFIIILSSILGSTDMKFYELTKDTGLNMVSFMTYRFGFANPNTLPIIIFSITMYYNFLQSTYSISKKILLVEFGLTCATFVLFGSRTYIVVSFFYLISMFIFPKLLKLPLLKFLIFPFKFSFIIITAIILFVTQNYYSMDSSWSMLNTLLSGRLFTWNLFVNTYGIHFLGSNFLNAEASASNMSLDNGYIFILLAAGILGLIVYEIIFTYVLNFAYKKSLWNLFIIAISYSLYGVFERGVLLHSICIIVLIFGFLVLNSSSIVEKELEGKIE